MPKQNDLGGSALAYVRTPDHIDLTVRQIAMLAYLCDNPPELRGHFFTVRAIAAAMNVAKPVITRATNTFIKHGLANRITDMRDKRSILIEPTDAGRELREVMRCLR